MYVVTEMNYVIKIRLVSNDLLYRIKQLVDNNVNVRNKPIRDRDFSSVGDRFDRVAMFFCCTNERCTRSGAGILTPSCDLRQWQNAEVFGKKPRTNCSRGRQASAREMEVDLVRGRSKGQNNIRRDHA